MFQVSLQGGSESELIDSGEIRISFKGICLYSRADWGDTVLHELFCRFLELK